MNAAMRDHPASGKKRVLAANVMGKTGWDILAGRADIEVVPFPNTIPQDEFRALLRQFPQVHGVILGLTRFGRAELAAAPGLQVVSRIGVGYDAVDIPAMSESRIPVMVANKSNDLTVAEHTIHALLALAKRCHELNALVKEGRWLERMSYLPSEIYGRELLVIGYGRIGVRVAAMAQALGMGVRVYDPYVSEQTLAKAGFERVADLDQALERADFVSLHCPKTEETLGMIGEARLARFKPGAYLINTARGGIVDEAALYRALSSGRLGGAALDVFLPEPPSPDNPLLQLPNVLCSPHLAGVGRESVERMAYLAANNVLNVFDGVPQRANAINPEVFAQAAVLETV